jgi:hypothetical protein
MHLAPPDRRRQVEPAIAGLLRCVGRDARVGPTGLGLLRSAPAVGALHAGGCWAAGCWARSRSSARQLRRLRPVAVVPGLAHRSRGQRLRRHDQHQHPLDGGRARDPRTSSAAASTWSRTFINASNQLGAFESGAAAALVRAVPALVAGGVATIVVAIPWKRAFPALAAVDRLERLAPECVEVVPVAAAANAANRYAGTECEDIRRRQTPRGSPADSPGQAITAPPPLGRSLLGRGSRWTVPLQNAVPSGMTWLSSVPTTSTVNESLNCSDFVKPFDGLEPSTPSLPCARRGHWSQRTATVLACFGSSGAGSICGRLPPIATTGLHKGSILGCLCRIRRR